MKRGLVLLVALGMLGACSHKKVMTGNNKVTSPGVVSLWAGWVKDRKTRYDLQLNVSNESTKSILIQSDDVHCYRGSSEGHIKNAGDGKIVLNSGQSKSFNTHCDFDGHAARGDFKIRVQEVFGNPGDDGVTKGGSLARNVELAVPEASIR